ncbi:MAG: YicC family protein [Methylococcaceae bacterium]|nr:YicC family protein [Methylococcaceae bacterium]
MIKSMTAFASSEAEIENLIINCELRSVNHRYCDITLKLPERLRYTEAAIRSSISSVVKRGKIECSLSYKKQSNGIENITINENAVLALLHATSLIEEHMHTQQSFTALEILNIPGIQQQPEMNKDSLLLGIKGLIEDALKQLLTARTAEGAQLKLLIQERCKIIQDLVVSANNRLPEVLAHLRTKINTRLTELVTDPDFDRLEQEMVFLAQKLDVAEELDRLDAHVQAVLSILNNNEPVGRRLDFLMQEMNREANTLGSKSADKEMTQISIDLKVLIEQMREQIQNIE